MTEVLLEPANTDLENAVALEILEARKADDLIDQASESAVSGEVNTPEKAASDQASDSEEDSTAFGENGQSTLF